jgi:DNA relaxase NicK
VLENIKKLRLLQRVTGDGKCNRIDIGCSDFEKKLPVDNLIEALKNKNYSGFENRKQFHDFESFGTLNLGARTSQRFTRVYDECARLEA